MNNLWDDVSGPEATTGVTGEFRMIYVKNANATSNTFLNAKIWVTLPGTASTHDDVYMGLDPAPPGSNSSKSTSAYADPGGISWTNTATSEGTALVIGDMAAGQQKAVWFKRTVQAGAAAFSSNNYEVVLSGETT